jgi:hypothetical protein
MPYLVLARELAFQKTDPADPTVPVGPEELVTRGQFVPDYVPAATVNALSAAGLLAWAEAPDPAVIPFDSQPAQVRTPDQPVVLPSDPNGEAPLLADVLGDTGTSDVAFDVTPVTEEQPGQQVPDLPKNSDSKETWENFAQLPIIGMSQGEAEAMNKTDLQAEVKKRYAAATA